MYAYLGSVNLCGVGLCSVDLRRVDMRCVCRLAEPEGEGVKNHVLHRIADGDSLTFIYFGSICDELRATMEY